MSVAVGCVYCSGVEGDVVAQVTETRWGKWSQLVRKKRTSVCENISLHFYLTQFIVKNETCVFNWE